MSKLVPYLAVFAGLVMCAIVIPGALESLKIALDFEHFESARARVVSTRTQKHSRGPATARVEFEFVTADGTEVKGDNAITKISDSPERIDRLVEREKGVERITVYFDPADPRRVVIHEISLWQPLGFIGLSLFLLFGGTHALVIDRRRRQMQARADEARERARKRSTESA